MKRLFATLAVLVALTMLLPGAYAQMMMGGHGSMMNNNTDNQANGTMMNRGMMGSGMMGGNMMGNGMMSGSMMGSGMMNPLAPLMNLGLSDSQIEKMIDIQAQYLKESLESQRSMMNARQQLVQLQQADNPDYGEIEKQMVQISKDQATMMKLDSQIRDDARQVLTAEQKQQLGDNPLPMQFGMNCPMMGSGSMMNMMNGGQNQSGMMQQSNNGMMSGGHNSHH